MTHTLSGPPVGVLHLSFVLGDADSTSLKFKVSTYRQDRLNGRINTVA